ncbi:MAG TPA: hypothetical protein VNW99_10645 [Cytophagaceae bacterium]|jgi:hypothetical protein|nr:hypothetical protein [Cytophagaceae bacterium]
MNLTGATQNLLSELAEVIKRIDPEDYAKPVSVLSDATIGQHIRHIIEFYDCLIKGAHSGIVNYDLRERDKEIEENKFISLSKLHFISEALLQCDTDKEIILTVSFDLNSAPAENIKTNLGRELVYNIEHVVHHMAIIKIGIRAACSYIQLPPSFGIASSTLKYQQQNNVHSNLSA